MKQEKKAQTDKETLPVWAYFVLSVPFVPGMEEQLPMGKGSTPAIGSSIFINSNNLSLYIF